MTSEQLKGLREIRAGFLLGLTSKDLLYIKMQINKLDTVIYEASKNNKEVSGDAVNFVEWMDIVCIRDGRFEWKYNADNYKKKHTTKEMYVEWLKLTKKI